HTIPAPPARSSLSLHDALPISGRVGLAEDHHHRNLRRRRGRPSGEEEGRGRAGTRGERADAEEGHEEVRRTLHTRSPITPSRARSEEHTSELQSLTNIVCRLLL